MQKSDHLLFLENIRKTYGKKVVLEDIDLAVSKGEFCTVVGPSGCGKSTLLRLIIGQESPASGKIRMEGKALSRPSPERGIVYQRYALFPHLRVVENIMIGKLLPLPFWKGFSAKKAAREEAMKYLEDVNLSEHADKYPHQLSGGMQQRVAIAQALITRPKILMMDEPFGALDPGTREAMQVLILQLREAHNMTVFFVTHDLEEAVFLGSRLLVVSQYYSEGKETGKSLGKGSRIVSDYPLNTASLKVKETAEFAQFIQQIRHEGFDSEHLQHVTQFNLDHPDSFQILTETASLIQKVP